MFFCILLCTADLYSLQVISKATVTSQKLEVERDVPDMDMNPLLAKRFASQRNVHKRPSRMDQGQSPH